MGETFLQNKTEMHTTVRRVIRITHPSFICGTFDPGEEWVLSQLDDFHYRVQEHDGSLRGLKVPFHSPSLSFTKNPFYSLAFIQSPTK